MHARRRNSLRKYLLFTQKWQEELHAISLITSLGRLDKNLVKPQLRSEHRYPFVSRQQRSVRLQIKLERPTDPVCVEPLNVKF